MEPVLDYLARDVTLSLGTNLWLIRGDTAQTAMRAGGETGVEPRLSTLRTDSETGAAGMARTAGEVLSDLLERGSAYLPALEAADPEQSQGETVLLEAGYGVLRDGVLVGYLTGERARGLELLTGHTAEDVVEVDLPSGRTAARITGASVRCEPVFQEDELKALRLLCRVTAELAEFSAPLGDGELDQLRQELEERESLRLQQVMDRLQSWGADCAGLGSQVGRADPGRWERIRGDWDQRFSSVPLEISVEVSVTRTGEGAQGSGADARAERQT